MPEFGPYERPTTITDAARVTAEKRPDEGYEPDVPDDVERGDWAIWLPHDCDDWVIAHGSPEHVVAEARKLIDALEAAIAHVLSAPAGGTGDETP